MSAPKNAKMPLLRITTPQGVALWPKLAEPDTKFDADGVYTVDLILAPDDAAPIQERAEKFLDEFVVEQAKLLGKKPAQVRRSNTSPWKPDTDKDGADTGNLRLHFKMKASAVSKKSGTKLEFTPAIFDKFGKPMEATNLGSGSLIKVNFEVNPWYVPSMGAGVSFRLNAVQVLEAKTRGKSDNAKDYGFDVADPETTAEEAAADESGGFPAESPQSGGDF